VKIVRLPGERLRVPVTAHDEDSIADGTEIIGPDDPRYLEYSLIALTEDEHAARDRGFERVNADLLARWGTDYEAGASSDAD
jgi:hypothetical protein